MRVERVTTEKVWRLDFNDLKAGQVIEMRWDHCDSDCDDRAPYLVGIMGGRIVLTHAMNGTAAWFSDMLANASAHGEILSYRELDATLTIND